MTGGHIAGAVSRKPRSWQRQRQREPELGKGLVVSRFLSVRIPNLSIQLLSRRLASAGVSIGGLAMYSPHRDVTEISETTAAALKQLHAEYPAARRGPVLSALNAVAWEQGLRPGMPLEEARSLLRGAVSGTIRTQNGSASGEDLQLIPWDPAADREELRDLAEALRRFAPAVAFDESSICDTLLLDITGCAPLFGDEQQLAELLSQELRERGLVGVIGIAGRVSLSRALAHISPAAASRSVLNSSAAAAVIRILQRDRIEELPDRMPLQSGRLPQADCELLQQLGIRDLRRALMLPVRELPARLSEHAVLRIRQLLGTAAEGLLPLPERDPVCAVWAGDEPAEGMRDLTWILGELVGEIVEQLKQRQLMCTVLVVELENDSGATAAYETALVRAEDSASLLTDVVTLRLQYLVQREYLQQQRLKSAGARDRSPGAVDRPVVCEQSEAYSAGKSDGRDSERGDHQPRENHDQQRLSAGQMERTRVTRVQMRANSVAIPSHRQRDLFGTEESFEVAEELASLVTRLTGRLGPGAVRRFAAADDVRPEFALQAIPIAEAAADAARAKVVLAQLTGAVSDAAGLVAEGGVISPRPLRLLAEPLDITAGMVSDDVRAEPPEIRAFGSCWRIRERYGPERIHTGWWTDQPCSRDYYRLLSDCGSRLWVYRRIDTGRWYLHGFFD